MIIRKFISVMCVIFCIMFFGINMANASSSYKKLNCNTTSDDLYSIYQRGKKAKVNKMFDYEAEDWEKRYLSKRDAKILGRIGLITNDWSGSQDTINWRISDYITGMSKLKNEMTALCQDDEKYAGCKSYYNNVEECAVFNSERYTRLSKRLDEYVSELLSEPIIQYEKDVRVLAKKMFGIERKNQVIVGLFMGEPTLIKNTQIDSKFIEQINMKVANDYQTYMHPTKPKIKQGEFEKSADYKKRVADIQSEWKQTVEKRANDKNVSYSAMLESELNRHSIVLFDKESIQYNPDEEAFTIKVYIKDTNLSFNMLLPAPISKAKALKSQLSEKPPIIFSDKLKGAWLLAPPKKKIGYLPWLVFENKNNKLSLKGGLLLKVLSKNREPITLKIDKNSSLNVAVGKKAAESFTPIFNKLLAKKVNDKKKREAANHKALCNKISNAAAYKSPEKYWMLMKVNRCL